jgi:hypothetical protein
MVRRDAGTTDCALICNSNRVASRRSAVTERRLVFANAEAFNLAINRLNGEVVPLIAVLGAVSEMPRSLVGILFMLGVTPSNPLHGPRRVNLLT